MFLSEIASGPQFIERHILDHLFCLGFSASARLWGHLSSEFFKVLSHFYFCPPSSIASDARYRACPQSECEPRTIGPCPSCLRPVRETRCAADQRRTTPDTVDRHAGFSIRACVNIEIPQCWNYVGI